MPTCKRHSAVLQCALGAVLTCLALAANLAAQSRDNPHVGRVLDSSYHHLLVSGGLMSTSVFAARQEPRVMMRLQQSAANAEARQQLAIAGGFRGVEAERPSLWGGLPTQDWAVSLGSGNIAPNMYPAKYSFNLNSAPNCAGDYAVFALNVAGVTGGQANLVGINNLYSGTTPTGLCGTTPTVNWAYNGSTNGGSVLTSPQLSLDGTRIAYVESLAAGAVFHVLTWKAGEGTSATASAAPVTMGSCTATSSCLISFQYSGTSTTTLASPWIDYSNDKVYLASDDGKIYRLSCAFTCPLNTAPTLDWAFTLPVAGTGGAQPVPNGPIFDSSSGLIIVGDQLGEIWVLKDGIVPSVFAGPAMIGGGGCSTVNPPGRIGTPTPCTANGRSFGIPDSPLLDVSVHKLYVFTGNDGTAGASAAVVQMNENLSGVVRVHIGRGSRGNVTTNVDLHDGAFDDAYFGGTPTAGHLFMCGTGAANTRPFHYWIGFANYPTMDAAVTGSLQRLATAGIPCTPYTEIYNPTLNLGGNPNDHDLLVSGLTAGGVNGLIVSNDISTGAITGNLRAVNYPGGISGIITDNISSQPQASSVYFSTLTNSAVGTCPNTRCAVKLTQGALR